MCKHGKLEHRACNPLLVHWIMARSRKGKVRLKVLRCARVCFAAMTMVAASALAGAVPATAAGMGWTQVSPATSPTARNFGTMAYDGTTGNVVLFGGHGNGSSPLVNTWLWNGTEWVSALIEKRTT